MSDLGRWDVQLTVLHSSLLVCVCVLVPMLCGGQRETWDSLFSVPAGWAPEIELGSSGCQRAPVPTEPPHQPIIFIFGSISQWSRIHQYGLLSWPVSPRYPPFCVSSVLGLQAYHHSQLFMWMHKPDSGPPHRFVLLLFFSLWILNTKMEFIDGIYF